ncbi:holo-ACP synthase [Carnobacteriaceae bacterium zg-ZUI240]|nr:holo-ACP synthase [Carnobacteriaceae bacterium zg-ZUI240]
MIYGIGLDVTPISRIAQAVKKNERFVDRVLTQKELELYHAFTSDNRKNEFLSGRFAAKEAFSKAFGTGIGALSFLDMEILPDERNKPVMSCTKFQGNVFVSITHSNELAIAQVVLEVE